MEFVNGNFLILHSNYIEIIKDIQKIPRSLPKVTSIDMNLLGFNFPNNGKLTNPIEDIKNIKLYPTTELLIPREIYAYDESIKKYSCLEGDGYLTAHSLIHLGDYDYDPKGLLSFYFYTHSKLITEKSKLIRYSEDPEIDSKKDYIQDRILFLAEQTPRNSILLIDGPLIGGDVYTYMIRSIDAFLEKDIIPVFFVKNSNSNMVCESIDSFSEKYNSDMHWSYDFLSKGERTNFFVYTDKYNKQNAKIFCYIKAYNKSPQRIEFHIKTYDKHKDEIEKILNLVYYYLLAQGEKNPQVRPIAVAEKYAREFIKLSDLDKVFFNYGLVPTMNQERFGR